MTELLKPCPCCGADPQEEWSGGRQILCERCGLGTSVEDTPEKALAVWNTRVPDATLSAEVERVNNIASDLQSLCDKQALALGDERAEVERLRGERDANHNLAIANGSRAKEEEARAEAAQAEVERVRRLYREAIQLADAHRRRAEAVEARVKRLEEVAHSAWHFMSFGPQDRAKR